MTPAVALVVWRESGALPPVAADDETGLRDLLVTEREGLVVTLKRFIARAIWRWLQKCRPGPFRN